MELSLKSYDPEKIEMLLTFLQAMPFFHVHNTVIQALPDDQAEATCDIAIPHHFTVKQKAKETHYPNVIPFSR